MKRLGVILLLAAGVVAGSQPVASAAGPPKAVLTSGSETQEGSVKAYCWNDTVIMQTCLSQDFYVFPKQAIQAQGQAAILIEKPEPPDVVSIRYWTRISRDDVGSAWFDRPRGKARTVEAELEPILTSAGLQWKATFDPPDEKIVYMAAKAEWTVEALCPGCHQWVTWAFSLQQR